MNEENVTNPLERLVIKPCPFCGGEDIHEDTTLLEETYHICGNDKCRAFGPVGETRQEAIEAWNKRAL